MRAQPQRPGELTELIDIGFADSGLLSRLERALQEGATLFAVDAIGLAADLDKAASTVSARELRNALARPLFEYSRALEAGLSHPEESEGAIRVRVPHQVAARWTQSAAASGVSFERWLARTLELASGARVSWEAAAARSARTLSEWVLVQAASSARSRSTAPHTSASS